MIYGNRVGGVTPEKTYIITNEDETVKFSAVAIELNDEDAPFIFTAKSEDVAAGKRFVGDGGACDGTNTCPRCRDLSGIHEVHPNVDVDLLLEEYDMWDYSYLQGYISTKDDPYNVLMLIADNAVYQNGELVSNVEKDEINKTIRFNVTNNSEDVYLLHYFICKEEQ